MTVDEFARLIEYIEGASNGKKMPRSTRNVWWMELNSFQFDDMMQAARAFCRSPQARNRWLHPLVADILNQHWDLKQYSAEERKPNGPPFQLHDATAMISAVSKMKQMLKP